LIIVYNGTASYKKFRFASLYRDYPFIDFDDGLSMEFLLYLSETENTFDFLIYRQQEVLSDTDRWSLCFEQDLPIDEIIDLS